jgi:TolA-binding protein
MKRKWILPAVISFALTTLCLPGCSTPEQKAQKLFSEGKYEEVVARYPDLPVAQLAKDKLAEALFNEGDFAGVIENYPDSPFAAQARNRLADALYQEGKYEEVIAQYPDSPAAKLAQEKLAADLLATADALKDKRKQAEICQQVETTYPGTEAAARARKLLDEGLPK